MITGALTESYRISKKAPLSAVTQLSATSPCAPFAANLALKIRVPMKQTRPINQPSGEDMTSASQQVHLFLFCPHQTVNHPQKTGQTTDREEVAQLIYSGQFDNIEAAVLESKEAGEQTTAIIISNNFFLPNKKTDEVNG